MKTVLILEDQPLLQRATARLCQKAEAAWHVAGNGQEALDYLKTHPLPDLIICDVTMPVMTGPEFVAQRGSIPGLTDVPLILYTGERDGEELAAKLGVLHYTKGDAPALFLDMIRKYTRDA